MPRAAETNRFGDSLPFDHRAGSESDSQLDEPGNPAIAAARALEGELVIGSWPLSRGVTAVVLHFEEVGEVRRAYGLSGRPARRLD
jgi:hypothetical protein